MMCSLTLCGHEVGIVAACWGNTFTRDFAFSYDRVDNGGHVFDSGEVYINVHMESCIDKMQCFRTNGYRRHVDVSSRV